MRHRLLLVGVMIGAFIPGVSAAHAMTVAGVIGDDSGVVRWSGQFMVGVAGPGLPSPEAFAASRACDAVAIEVGIPSASWTGAPGGLLVAVQWPVFDAGYDLDLHVYRIGEEAPVGSSTTTSGSRPRRSTGSRPTAHPAPRWEGGPTRASAWPTVGAADVYPWYIADQYLDISNIPDGRYLLRVEINRGGKLIEKTQTNSVAVTCVALTGHHATTC